MRTLQSTLLLCVFCFAFCFGFTIHVYAQNSSRQKSKEKFTLSGSVIDAVTKSVLPGASVLVLELKQGESTDNDGRFSLTIPADNYHLITRFVGYTDDTLALTLTDNQERIIRLKPGDVKLDEVRVTAGRDQEYLTKSSQSIAVLTAKDLDKFRGQTLGESIGQLPGVTVLQTGPSISKPVVRGLHSDRILVLNGGVPQEGQQWGGEHAPEIDPFAPASIEVLKGASGVEYGSGAIGGVIKIEPRSFRDIPGIGGQLTLNGFSNNLQGAGSLLLEGAHDALPGFAWRAQGSFRRAGNERAPDYIIGNTGFKELNGSIAAQYKINRTDVEALYSYFDTELGIYKGSHIGSTSDLERAIAAGHPLTNYMFSYDIKPPLQKISHELWSVKAQQEFPAVGRLEMQAGRQSNHRQEFDAFRFFNNQQTLPTTAAFDLTLTTYSVDIKLKHNPIGDVVGTVGISGMRQGNVGGGSSFLIPNFRSYSGGAFVFEGWSNEYITISGGVRYDYRWMKVYPYATKQIPETILRYSNFSGALGGVYRFAKAWSAAVNFGTAFRPPSINELYSDGVHHGTAQYERGDPNLQSEQSFSVDATLRHSNEASQAELSVYNNYMRNFIFLFPNAAPVLTLRGVFPAFSYKQANAVLRGIDGSFEYRFTDMYKLGGTLSVVRGQNLATNEPLFQMPSDRIKFSNTFTLHSTNSFDTPSFELSIVAVRRQDRFPAGVDYLDPPPGYLLFDCGFTSDITIGAQPLRFNIGVHNLFNASYRDYLSRFRYYINEPGRDIVVRVQIPFGQFEQH